MTENFKKHLIITIDVEAGPHLQSADHVDRLIWGKFGDQELGIGRMMEIAERYGCKLTFFLDYCETLQYPGAFEKVSRYISEHGHDIQLHAHTQFLTEAFWKQRGLRPFYSGLDQYSKEHAAALMGFLADCALNSAGKPAIAFRGGAFRYNRAVLDAMTQFGIGLSFNYNIKTPWQVNNERNRGIFRWSNGVVEVPMSYINLRNKMREFEFSSTSSIDFSDQALVRDYTGQFFSEFGSSAVLVMLLHSWSFLYREKKGQSGFYYECKGPGLAQIFEQFLASLGNDIRVITASELHALIKDGVLAVKESRSIEEVDSINQRIKAIVAANVPARQTVAVISKGDDDLLDLAGRQGWHFPRAQNGSYAGYHPAHDAEAISQLAAVKAEGAQFLIIPAHSFWWLDYYKGFGQYLDSHYGRMYSDEDCLIYRLVSPQHPPDPASAQVPA
jgi:hypothetical protein